MRQVLRNGEGLITHKLNHINNGYGYYLSNAAFEIVNGGITKEHVTKYLTENDTDSYQQIIYDMVTGDVSVEEFRYNVAVYNNLLTESVVKMSF